MQMFRELSRRRGCWFCIPLKNIFKFITQAPKICKISSISGLVDALSQNDVVDFLFSLKGLNPSNSIQLVPIQKRVFQFERASYCSPLIRLYSYASRVLPSQRGFSPSRFCSKAAWFFRSSKIYK